MKKLGITTAWLMMLSLFSLQQVPSASAADLYAFTSHTFTNCSKTGATGPALADCRTSYSAQTWSANSSYFNVGATGIQYWTVPKSGIYTLRVAGASGGAVSGKVPGAGSTMQGDFTLAQGSVLAILVGQSGIASMSAGGGGGSFVVQVPAQGDTSTSGVLIVAGGGGGSGSNSGYTFVTTAESATITTSSDVGGCGSSVTGCSTIGYLLSNNANNGAGGGAGIYGYATGAGGGGGLLSSGANNTAANGGASFLAGGAGGAKVGGGSVGGFGGGGASEYASYSGSGGGGGYSGGGGGVAFAPGGGGGSYNSGTNQTNTAGNNVAMGFVTVTFLSAWTQPAITSTNIPQTATYRNATSISATVNASGKVTFLASGKVISGCKSLVVSNSNGGTATCSWRPAVHGSVSITAQFVSGIYTDKSTPATVGIGSRSSKR
jgi:hypothetical protein